jgi:hypothetical protein
VRSTASPTLRGVEHELPFGRAEAAVGVLEHGDVQRLLASIAAEFIQ